MKKAFFAVFLMLFVVSCGPSANPQLKAKISPYFTQDSSTRIRASKKFYSPMPLAIGQYAVYGTTEDDGTRSITKTSIVGREAGGWIYESYTLSETQEGTVQMLIRGLEKVRKSGNIDDIELLWVKIKGEDGKVEKLEGPVLMMAKSLYKKHLSGLDVTVSQYVNGGTVKVPAGSFAGTNMVKSEVTFWGKKYKSTGWYHYKVPINGMVKSVTDDGDSTMVLLEYGTRGAKSSF